MIIPQKEGRHRIITGVTKYCTINIFDSIRIRMSPRHGSFVPGIMQYKNLYPLTCRYLARVKILSIYEPKTETWEGSLTTRKQIRVYLLFMWVLTVLKNIILSQTVVLLFIHVGRVPQREWDDLIALLVVRCPTGPDEGVQLSVDWCIWFGAVLQVEQVQVGLSTVHLGGGEGWGLDWPCRCGGDELVQGLAVVILQIQRQRLCWCRNCAAWWLWAIWKRQTTQEANQQNATLTRTTVSWFYASTKQTSCEDSEGI